MRALLPHSVPAATKFIGSRLAASGCRIFRLVWLLRQPGEAVGGRSSIRASSFADLWGSSGSAQASPASQHRLGVRATADVLTARNVPGDWLRELLPVARHRVDHGQLAV